MASIYRENQKTAKALYGVPLSVSKAILLFVTNSIENRRLKLIPIAKNKVIFKPRERGLKLAIVSCMYKTPMSLTIVDFRRFDALKYDFIFREWYHFSGLRENLPEFL